MARAGDGAARAARQVDGGAAAALSWRVRRLPARRLSGAAGALGLLVASLVVALGIGELLARAMWAAALARPVGAARMKPPPRTFDPPLEGLPELKTLSDLARPNVRGVHKGLPFRRNSRGLRGGETSRFPAPGVFRIVVSGDSVTMGSGVLEEEAYPARLETLLNAEAEAQRYEVLNLGLSGINIEWAARRMRAIGLDYYPDLLVYGYTVNDIEGDHYVSSIEPEAVDLYRQRFLRFLRSPFYLLRIAWPRLLALLDLWRMPKGTYPYDVDYNYTKNPAAWRDFTAGLDAFAELGERTGRCVHVLIHTQLVQLNGLHPFRGVYAQVERAAVERGLTVSQSFDAFRGKRAVEVQLNILADSHPNAYGHEILARVLRDGLRELPARCLVKRPPPVLELTGAASG